MILSGSSGALRLPCSGWRGEGRRAMSFSSEAGWEYETPAIIDKNGYFYVISDYCARPILQSHEGIGDRGTENHCVAQRRRSFFKKTAFTSGNTPAKTVSHLPPVRQDHRFPAGFSRMMTGLIGYD
jgi:hypothetical protein